MDQCSANSRSVSKRRLTLANLRRIWVGADGLRAGWATLLFWIIVAALMAGAIFALHRVFPHGHASEGVTVSRAVLFECVMIAAGLAATKIMSMIDRRSWLDYGLRDPRGLVFFVQGAGVGIVAMSVLIATLSGLHAIHVERSTASVGYLAEAGFAWGVVFLFVGISEEVIFRGYAFFRLSRGIRPWLAALINAVVFAAAHGGNAGETVVGLISVVGAGLLLCLIVWRTQSLWWAIGFHAAWDWTKSFVFGVADSGATSAGHWLSSQTSGPAWLTGGTVGPEGSVLMLPLLVVVALGAIRFLPKR